MNGIQVFNRVISSNLIDNTRFLSGRAGYLPVYADIFRNLKKKELVREILLEDSGITVPPILIISVTNDCNLSCSGCYACAQERERENEISAEDVDRIIGEGIDAGVGIVFIAGGEPLMKKNILDIPAKYKNTLFVLFTNGTLIDEKRIREFKRIRNLVPVFSLEGDEDATDSRRGSGVYKSVSSAMRKLDEKNLMFGASITLTRENYHKVINNEYLSNLDGSGCRALFLIEYVPCEGDPELCLTETQKADLLKQVKDIKHRYSMLPVALPGNEEKYGGCLAAGRGFLHVSSTGAVEACPFAPFSDVNLKDMSFTEALRSRLLNKIRDNHHMLEEAEGGCTLFENKEWVEELCM